MTATRVFCASTGFHVLLHQAIVLAESGTGDRNHLVLYHPLARADRPNHTRGPAAVISMLLPEYWTSVIPAGDLAARFDIGNAAESAGSLAAAGLAQRELDRRLGSIGPPTDVYVTNPTCGAIDRHLWTLADAGGATRHFVEDGISAYLPVPLKDAIDAPYWRDRPRKERATEPWLDLAALRLSADAPLVFDRSHLLLPAKLPGTEGLGEVRELSLPTVKQVLDQVVSRQLTTSAVRPQWSAMYISRPDHEDGLVPVEAEVENAVEAIRALRAMGHEVVVKPHPRDSKAKVREIVAAGRADLVEEKDDVPIEVLLARYRPALACGTWSGSVLYSALLADVTTTSVLPRLVRQAGQGPGSLLARIEREFARIVDGLPNYRRWEQLP